MNVSFDAVLLRYLPDLALIKTVKCAIERQVKLTCSGGASKTGFCIRIAVDLISVFVRVNWLGPSLQTKEWQIWDSWKWSNLKGEIHQLINKSALDALNSDGEQAYHLSKHPLCLLCSKWIFEALLDCQKVEYESQTRDTQLWLSRCLFLQQQLLDNPSGSLLNRILYLIQNSKNLTHNFVAGSGCGNKENEIQFLAKTILYEGLVHQYHHRNENALECFERAQELVGFKWQLTGAMGKRLKYQNCDIAQLTLETNKDGPRFESTHDKEKDNLFPIVRLDDEVLLDSVIYNSKREHMTLSQLEQCFLLAFW